MEQFILQSHHLTAFAEHLQQEERSPATIEKYLQNVRQFSSWLNGAPLTKGHLLQWKEALIQSGYQPSTVNGKLTAVSSLIHFLGWDSCRVRQLKLQRRSFCHENRELNKAEYERLLQAASAAGDERLCLLMQTICATGIRISELSCITVDAVKKGQAVICLKGKVREILLPAKLRRKLQKFAAKNKITSGVLFRTRSGKPVCRKQVWAKMKQLCSSANVDAKKVYPHNLRHLFARIFYQVCRDIAKLADILGHTSINTTRLYLISTGTEHRRLLNRLQLVQ